MIVIMLGITTITVVITSKLLTIMILVIVTIGIVQTIIMTVTILTNREKQL